MYLLDTSAVISLFEDRNAQVIDLLDDGGTQPTFWLSIITRGELAKGVAAASPEFVARRVATKRHAVARGQWVHPDQEIADRWGQLAATASRSIGANDLWIAATALQLAVPLVTGDMRQAEFVRSVGGDVVTIIPLGDAV